MLRAHRSSCRFEADTVLESPPWQRFLPLAPVHILAICCDSALLCGHTCVCCLSAWWCDTKVWHWEAFCVQANHSN